jgi:hypothetical protein
MKVLSTSLSPAYLRSLMLYVQMLFLKLTPFIPVIRLLPFEVPPHHHCHPSLGSTPENHIEQPFQLSLQKAFVVLYWFSLSRCIVWGAGDYSVGDLLGGKYEVQGIIGRGSNGVTYKVKAAHM